MNSEVEVISIPSVFSISCTKCGRVLDSLDYATMHGCTACDTENEKEVLARGTRDVGWLDKILKGSDFNHGKMKVTRVITFSGSQTYSCPSCHSIYENLQDARACCSLIYYTWSDSR